MALATIFERARTRGAPALIPYIMAGDPDAASTAAILACLPQAGADAVELGIPYGDPLADGPTIQAAGQRALAGGMSIDGVFALAQGNRAAGGVPTILFTYYNPVLQYGIERFARSCKDAGVAAAIIPDVPYEEIEDQLSVLVAHGIEIPLLVSPTTPPKRAAAIAKRASGFVYVVSRLGVTGAGAAPETTALIRQIDGLRAASTLPLVAGFGISTAAHVAAVAAHVDGVIVGSALIDACEGAQGSAAAQRASAFLTSLL